MGLKEEFAKLTNEVKEIVSTVKNQANVWKNAVDEQLQRSEDWKNAVDEKVQRSEDWKNAVDGKVQRSEDWKNNQKLTILKIDTILLNANGGMALSVTANGNEIVWGLEKDDFIIPSDANYVRFTVHGMTHRTTTYGAIKLPIYFDGDIDTLYVHDEDHYLNSFSRMTEWGINPTNKDRKTSFKIGVDGDIGTETIYIISVQAEFYRKG
jgi:hypothetical protein